MNITQLTATFSKQLNIHMTQLNAKLSKKLNMHDTIDCKLFKRLNM